MKFFDFDQKTDKWVHQGCMFCNLQIFLDQRTVETSEI